MKSAAEEDISAMRLRRRRSRHRLKSRQKSRNAASAKQVPIRIAPRLPIRVNSALTSTSRRAVGWNVVGRRVGRYASGSNLPIWSQNRVSCRSVSPRTQVPSKGNRWAARARLKGSS